MNNFSFSLEEFKDGDEYSLPLIKEHLIELYQNIELLEMKTDRQLKIVDVLTEELQTRDHSVTELSQQLAMANRHIAELTSELDSHKCKNSEESFSN